MVTPVVKKEVGAPARSTNLRWSVVAMLGLFSLIILLGISQRSADISQFERYYESTVIDDMASVQDRMGPMITGLHEIKENAEKKKLKPKSKRKRKGKGNKQQEMPDPKDLSNTETVWNFLYANTDDELIMNTDSEAEEESLRDNDLNVITLLVKKVEKERADEWLVQLAIWFHAVAEHWPKEVKLSDEAVDAIEELLDADFDLGADVSETSLSKMVDDDANIDTLKQEDEREEAADGASALRGEPRFNATKHLQRIETMIKPLLDSSAIQGRVAVTRLEDALDNKLNLREWRKLLTFLVSVSEAAPMFKAYLREWENTQFHKVEDVVFETSPIKKEQAMQESAKLLLILERGCETYPRTSRLIRAIFLKVLDEEEKAENAAAQHN